jgi:hypothetical protein
MSSCAASSCTCSHAASSASATSASSPTVSAQPCCHSASEHFRVSPYPQNLRFRSARHLERSLCRSALAAVERCSFSNDSPQRSYSSALHRAQTGAPHEQSATDSDHSHASACLPPLRLEPHQTVSTPCSQSSPKLTVHRTLRRPLPSSHPEALRRLAQVEPAP